MKKKHAVLVFLFSVIFSLTEARDFSFSTAPPNYTLNLLTFDAAKMALPGNIKIRFTTDSEKNIKEFIIYRSIDKQNWYVVGNFTGKNKSSVNKYEFIDRTGNGGMNYYRLEVIDLDGNREILKQLEIELEDFLKAIYITPDPLAGRIHLESAEQILSIELGLEDLLQRQYPVSFVRDDTHNITIITGPLSSGFYILKCYLNNERTVRKKTVIVLSDELWY